LILRRLGNIYSTVQYVQSKTWGNYGAFHPHLATRLATVTDGYVVLIHLWQLQTRRQLTPATER